MAFVVKCHIDSDFSTLVFTLTFLNTSFDQKPLCKTWFIHEPSLVCSLHEPSLVLSPHEQLNQRNMIRPDVYSLSKSHWDISFQAVVSLPTWGSVPKNYRLNISFWKHPTISNSLIVSTNIINSTFIVDNALLLKMLCLNYFQWFVHSGRNCFNLFQITGDAHMAVKDQKSCVEFKNTYYQVNHQAWVNSA